MGELAIHFPAHKDQSAFNLERWDELLSDPFYSRLEQRIETDRHGNIIMSPPPAFSHGRRGFQIAKLMELNAGATEVWLCEDDGSMLFFSAPDRQVKASVLIPDLPATI